MELGRLLDLVPERAGRAMSAGSVGLFRLTLEHAVEFPRYEQTLLRATRSLARRFQKTLETAFGAQMICDGDDDLFTAVSGLWEPNLTYEVLRTLRPGDTFVDVGAHHGYFVLLASRLVGPTGRVVAIEAGPRTFERLARNVELNGADNVRCIQRACMDRSGTVRFATSIDGATMKASAVRCEPQAEVVPVDAEPLDALLSKEELSSLRMLKVDVEGAEPLVFAGASRVLDEAPRDLTIACEASPSWSGMRTAEEVLAPLLSRGFEALLLGNVYSLTAYTPRTALSAPCRVSPLPSGQIDCILRRAGARSEETPRLSTVGELYRALKELRVG